jgi:hypothetical protein
VVVREARPHRERANPARWITPSQPLAPAMVIAVTVGVTVPYLAEE